MPAGRDDRERWNRKYREEPRHWLRPDPFLKPAFEQFVEPVFPAAGAALDLAAGAGRHSIWLARRGWTVTHIDISEVGIELARRRAGRLASRIHFAVDDLTRFRAPQIRFDLVVGFFYLDRAIFPEIVAAVRRGGFLIYKTYTAEQMSRSAGPKDAQYLLRPGELLRLAQGLKTLHYREASGKKVTAEIVAQRT